MDQDRQHRPPRARAWRAWPGRRRGLPPVVRREPLVADVGWSIGMTERRPDRAHRWHVPRLGDQLSPTITPNDHRHVHSEEVPVRSKMMHLTRIAALGVFLTVGALGLTTAVAQEATVPPASDVTE